MEKDPNGSLTLIVKMKNQEGTRDEISQKNDKFRRWSRTEYHSIVTGEKSTKNFKTTVERQTQTDKKISKMRQLFYCIIGDDAFRKQRQREAALKLESSGNLKRHVNSVSHIDQAARILFPLSFASLNLFYWFFYLHADYPKSNF